MRIWKYEDNGGTLTRRSIPSIVFFMLVIRFQRRGRTNDPAFRVVVTEKRSKPKSGELEILGSYHPKTKETLLKNERILKEFPLSSDGMSPKFQAHLISALTAFR